MNTVLEFLIRVNNGRELMRGNMDICDTETCRRIYTHNYHVLICQVPQLYQSNRMFSNKPLIFCPTQPFVF